MMAKVAVSPKEFQNLPTSPPMKATGRKMTTRESVVAVTARAISLVPVMAASNGRPPLLVDVPEDVLQHDDGVVDDDARGERQPEHGQVVEGEAGHAHGQERGDDGAGDGQGGHEGRAQLPHRAEEDHGDDDADPRHPQEQLRVAGEEGRAHRADDEGHRRDLPPHEIADEDGHDEAGQEAAEQQVILHLVDRALDEARQVAHHLELDVLGQALLDLGQPRLDAVHHGHRVGARLLADDEGHRVAAVQAGEGAGLLLAVHHGGDVADAHGAALEIGHDQLLEALGRLDAAEGAQALFLGPARDAPAGDLHVLAGQGVLHLLDAEPVTGEAVGVDEDLDLALLAPHDGDGPTSFTVSSWRLIRLSAISVISRGRALARDHHGHDRGRIGVGLLDDGGLGAGREAGDDGVHLLAHVVGRLLHVALEHEGGEDLRLPLDGAGAQLVEAGDGVDGLLDGLGDLALDLLRGGAGQARGDGDGGEIDLGEDVYPELREGGQAEHHQRGHEHGREDRPPDEDLQETSW